MGPTDTYTHPKELDAVGLFDRAGPGYLSCLVRSHRLEPPRWDSNPRPRPSAERSSTTRDRAAIATITVCRTLVQTTTDRAAIATITVSRTLVQTTTLLLRRKELLLPATRLLIGRWVVRRLVAASRLAGARVWCLSSAYWLEETFSAPPRRELPPEASKAPPTSSAKNTCVMATGSSAGRRTVVVVVVAVV